MSLEQVRQVAEAVLYEGYMLYPYRPSSVKNQRRWNFGVLCPRLYAEAQSGAEAWMMQTQCLVEGDAATTLRIRVRFLQLVNRSVGRMTHPAASSSPGTAREYEVVDRLEAGGKTFQPWQEAVEREVESPALTLELLASPVVVPIEVDAGTSEEPVRDDSGQVVGLIVREWRRLSGSMEIGTEALVGRYTRITVTVRNLTPFVAGDQTTREDALPHSFASAHTILSAEGGEFVSLLDPPEFLREDVAACKNVGAFPVLVGDAGEQDTMLSSPIILYDYPQIAPESAGNLFDGTEIDEILSLRILTLTDEEKREMQGSDERTRLILDRTETMPEEQFMKLHGVLRGLRPAGDSR